MPATRLVLSLVALFFLGFHCGTLEAAIGPVVTGGYVTGGTVGLSTGVEFQTSSPGNDNAQNAFAFGSNQIWIRDLQFQSTDSVDLVLNVQVGPPGSGATEYGVILGSEPIFGAATSIINSSGAAWSGFQITVGVVSGGTITPIGGLDFDTPDGDPTPSSNVFTFFQNHGSKINFLSGNVPSSNSVGNPSDTHHFNATFSLDIPNLANDYDLALRLTPLLATQIGESQDNPELPVDGDDPADGFEFAGPDSVNPNTGRTRLRWYDPPASAAIFSITPGETGLFTSVELPTGFDPMQIFIDGASQGTFAGGSTFDFGPGEDLFEIRGINPLFESTNPAAFPFALTFNEAGVDFTMTPVLADAAVPEPASLTIFALGLGCVAAGRIYRRKSR